jgi:hypothetical protein
MGTIEDEESDSDSNTTLKQKREVPQPQRRIVADKPKVISLKKTGKLAF